MSNQLQIQVLNPGMLTTIQDLGRLGYQAFGVPQSGAMDQEAARVANLLAGNEENAPLLEITVMGPELLFSGEAMVAITGGNLSPRLDGVEIPMYQTVQVFPGSRLKFGNRKSGARAYLAIAGNLQAEYVMGSAATYLRGAFGGYKGRKLMRGDVLEVDSRPSPFAELPEDFWPDYAKDTLRVTLDREENHFTGSGIHRFLSEPYQITPQSDRMGYRLAGAVIPHRKGPDIISRGITFGAIQVPGHGQPIVMMADRQTVGGYTQIGSVISADISVLAQKLPGETLRFQEVSLREAQEVLRTRLTLLRSEIRRV